MDKIKKADLSNRIRGRQMEERIQQAKEFLQQLKGAESKEDARYIVHWEDTVGKKMGHGSYACTLAKIRLLVGAPIDPDTDWVMRGVRHWLVPVSNAK